METSDEVWRDIPGWEGYYQASTHGRVRSMDRTVPSGKGGEMRLRGCLLKPTGASRGRRYQVVNLHYSGEIEPSYVHRLVLETFIGPCPPGREVNHIDSDPTNNRLDNLEYVTHSENVQHAHDNGRYPDMMGENGSNAKLTEDDVTEIRRLYIDAGLGTIDIATAFDVAASTVRGILARRTWAFVDDGHPAIDLVENLRGENHNKSKLTDRVVYAMRDRYYSGESSMTEMAAEHGVDISLVSRAVRGERWTHVPMPDSADR